MPIERLLRSELERAAARYPCVTVLGPRQSGKTTLCRAAFPRHAYRSLEDPDVAALAAVDPRGLLHDVSGGAVLDEIQRAPQLLSYLQGLVDEGSGSGRFVLTGSQHPSLHAAVSQTLAGRTAMLHLYPLSRPEVVRFREAPEGLDEALFSGGYPAIFDRGHPPREWLRDYVQTYVERDVRHAVNVRDLTHFQRFCALSAGRTGQLVNLSALAADAGLSQPTARAWLSVLEATWIVARLPPLRANVRKRLVKSPKVHLLDSGLAAFLLSIRSPADLRDHPLRGPIFESWVVAEVLKARSHHGEVGGLSFYRDRKGLEADLVVESDAGLLVVEVKAGRTLPSDAYGRLLKVCDVLAADPRHRSVQPLVVYGGDESLRKTRVWVLSWRDVGAVDWIAGRWRREE